MSGIDLILKLTYFVKKTAFNVFCYTKKELKLI